MKKLLFQFDTDTHPSVFDTVVAYDGGADHVIGHGGLTPENVKMLVEGAIFTRAPKEKKNTAIFIGGSNLSAGQALLKSVLNHFFSGFSVSVMLDSNGCNTTAAAIVAKLAKGRDLTGKNAVVLAGTGPVGQRAAVMLAKEGANVTITSRNIKSAEEICKSMHDRFGVSITPVEAPERHSRKAAIENAHVVLATGTAGVELLSEEDWQDNPTLELIADANTTPPLGIGGTGMLDKGIERHGKIIWGSLGFGPFKLTVHRACITKLFEDNKQVFDAENIYALAKDMA